MFDKATFPPTNEKFVKSSVNKLEIFTNYRAKFKIVWNTRKIEVFIQ